MTIKIRGRVTTGAGVGRRFVELPWVREQLAEYLGFNPYPGTLNLLVDSDMTKVRLLNEFEGSKITPEKGYFPGRLFKALVMGKVHGAILRPGVPGYPESLLEVVAPICLRGDLHLKDGDEVEVEVWLK